MASSDLSQTTSEVIAVWPCDHGGVLVEPGPALKGYRCHECGATATTYVRHDVSAVDQNDGGS